MKQIRRKVQMCERFHHCAAEENRSFGFAVAVVAIDASAEVFFVVDEIDCHTAEDIAKQPDIFVGGTD